MQKLLEDYGYIVIQAPLREDISIYRCENVIILNANLPEDENTASIQRITASLISTPITNGFPPDSKRPSRYLSKIAQ